MSNKCIFIDKDGTLIYDVPYNVNIDLIVLYEDIFEPLLKLQNKGYKIIIISNQAGLEKGLFTEKELIKAFDFTIRQLQQAGIDVLDYSYCPHDTDKYHNPTCQCRKPNPKLILDMAIKHQIDLHESWMIGDILSDDEAGNKAGCKTILIDRNLSEIPKITENSLSHSKPTYSSQDFKDLDTLVLHHEKQVIWNEIF